MKSKELKHLPKEPKGEAASIVEGLLSQLKKFEGEAGPPPPPPRLMGEWDEESSSTTSSGRREMSNETIMMSIQANQEKQLMEEKAHIIVDSGTDLRQFTALEGRKVASFHVEDEEVIEQATEENMEEDDDEVDFQAVSGFF